MRFLLTLTAIWGVITASAYAEPWMPLSPKDANLYKKIFAVQEKGEWTTADKLVSQLNDRVLMGYVLEQRYMHPTAYRSSYSELSRWLDAYADHPVAADLYRLAKRRQKESRAPRKPSGRPWRSAPGLPLHPTLVADYANPKFASEVRQIENSRSRKRQRQQ